MTCDTLLSACSLCSGDYAIVALMSKMAPIDDTILLRSRIDRINDRHTTNKPVGATHDIKGEGYKGAVEKSMLLGSGSDTAKIKDIRKARSFVICTRYKISSQFWHRYSITERSLHTILSL